MLLDIADALRSAMQKPVKKKNHQLKKPAVIDHRDQPEGEASEGTPSDMIQASVDESMEQIDPAISPVQSFSPNRNSIEEMLARKNSPKKQVDPEKRIRRT